MTDQGPTVGAAERNVFDQLAMSSRIWFPHSVWEGHPETPVDPRAVLPNAARGDGLTLLEALRAVHRAHDEREPWGWVLQVTPVPRKFAATVAYRRLPIQPVTPDPALLEDPDHAEHVR